jgi:hypothetical protein
VSTHVPASDVYRAGDVIAIDASSYLCVQTTPGQRIWIDQYGTEWADEEIIWSAVRPLLVGGRYVGRSGQLQ